MNVPGCLIRKCIINLNDQGLLYIKAEIPYLLLLSLWGMIITLFLFPHYISHPRRFLNKLPKMITTILRAETSRVVITTQCNFQLSLMTSEFRKVLDRVDRKTSSMALFSGFISKQSETLFVIIIVRKT